MFILIPVAISIDTSSDVDMDNIASSETIDEIYEVCAKLNNSVEIKHVSSFTDIITDKSLTNKTYMFICGKNVLIAEITVNTSCFSYSNSVSIKNKYIIGTCMPSLTAVKVLPPLKAVPPLVSSIELHMDDKGNYYAITRDEILNDVDINVCRYSVWMAIQLWSSPESYVLGIYRRIIYFPSNNLFYEWPSDLLKVNPCNDEEENLDTMGVLQFKTNSVQIKRSYLEKYTKYYQPEFADRIAGLKDLSIGNNAVRILNTCFENGHSNDLPKYNDASVTALDTVEFWQLWYYLGVMLKNDEELITLNDSHPLVIKCIEYATFTP